MPQETECASWVCAVNKGYFAAPVAQERAGAGRKKALCSPDITVAGSRNGTLRQETLDPTQDDPLLYLYRIVHKAQPVFAFHKGPDLLKKAVHMPPVVADDSDTEGR